MLKNYKKDINGVIRQIKINGKFNYDQNYSKIRYDRLGQIGDYMSLMRFGYIVKIIKRLPKSILDVGYGNGSFIKCAHSIMNKNCYANDIDPPYPLKNKNIKFESDIFRKSYDVITFFDVLEHFEDPYIIKNLKCNYISISLPNCHYLSDTWFKNWKHRRPNEHLWHFNNKSLKKFMKICGYQFIDYSFHEDVIRTRYDIKLNNILSGIFKKDC